MKEQALQKVVLPTSEDAAVATETLWAVPLGQGLFRLDNTPWHAFGCALGDVIRCDESSGNLPQFREIVRSSGNLTVRVFVKAGLQRPAVKEALFSMLKEHGCHYEGMGENSGLIAISIPVDTESDPILRYLEALEESGKADWDAANF